MTKLYPYIAFENTKEALEYYEEVFGATEINRLPVTKEQAGHFGLSQEDVTDATMHAEFTIASTQLFASDSFSKAASISGAISLMLDYDVNVAEDAQEIEALYDRVKDHDSITVEMPLAEQFWGGKMGVFTDRYGIRWMIHGQDTTAQ
ncbi:VOC family protein [Staphylococcus delphini]|uniref:VOC family protein n=1 Tax=Staphylococcus delphini TaxID=53344 RepID=UPI00191BDE33|nr:glyoxalase/bleomycin resistance/extradiol dioxygenase family protein [Staphylococcus delphini]